MLRAGSQRAGSLLTLQARSLLVSADNTVQSFQSRIHTLARQNKGRPCLAWAIQAREGCSCAAATEAMKPVVLPQPGSVKEHSHHLMIRIPPPSAPVKGEGIWWPPIMEKHPALVQAFAGVAEAKQKAGEALEGVVKVTAFEHVEVLDRSGDPTRVEILLFPQGVHYKGVPYDKIREVVSHQLLQDTADSTHSETPPLLGKKTSIEDFEGLGLFVCTHMSRDTRCGVLGGQLAEKLASLAAAKGLGGVKVFQASHVGGHKFAGNVLCHGAASPCDGDWYGGISKDDASPFLDALVNVKVGCDGGAEDAYLRRYWRGRMNMSKEEQVGLHEGSLAASGSESGSDSNSSSSDSDSSMDSPRTSLTDSVH